MACLINSAIALDCINGLGGIKTAYFLAGEITSTTEVAGEITAISGTGAFYQFELPKDTAFYNEAANVSNTNGSVYFEQVLTVVLQKMSVAKRNQILLLAQNRDLRIVFEDNNNQSYLVGETRGAVMSSGASATGTAVSDLNGYTLAFTAQEPKMAGILDGSLANIIGGGLTIVNA
jgi:hypothetical protein